VKIAEHPDVYLLPLPGFATPLIGVLCNDLKEGPLPDSLDHAWSLLHRCCTTTAGLGPGDCL